MAWVGNANNVLFDLAIGAAKLGVDVAVTTPKGYEMPPEMGKMAQESCSPGKLTQTLKPEEAIRDADILMRDTWISMGQEEEKAKRLKAFDGFQITSALAEKGGAKTRWKFLHCLLRHSEEVDDDIFYKSSSCSLGLRTGLGPLLL